MEFDFPYSVYCENLKKSNTYRSLSLTKERAIDFSTNDYLGLSRNPEVIQAANESLMRHGVGATGSRLLSGNHQLFCDFEDEIARDKNCESALVFNSGYQANSSILAALLDRKVLKKTPLCFFDRLNHASLYHGFFLSGAELVRYRHLNMDHLVELLELHKNEARPKFIVTETLFGMDGDCINPHRLLEIAKTAHAFVYLDEAHATGLFGGRGYGISTLCDWKEVPHLIMGTFSKAIGASGAYIATSKSIVDYLINHCGGFIYSTAPSPGVIGAARKAWELIPHLRDERKKLFRLAEKTRRALIKSGFDIKDSSTQIIPLIVGDEEKTLALRDQLKKESILVSAIRPPTVPPKTSRLRLAFTSAHTDDDVDQLLYTLKKHLL